MHDFWLNRSSSLETTKFLGSGRGYSSIHTIKIHC